MILIVILVMISINGGKGYSNTSYASVPSPHKHAFRHKRANFTFEELRIWDQKTAITNDSTLINDNPYYFYDEYESHDKPDESTSNKTSTTSIINSTLASRASTTADWPTAAIPSLFHVQSNSPMVSNIAEVTAKAENLSTVSKVIPGLKPKLWNPATNKSVCNCSACEICVDQTCVAHTMKEIFTPECELIDKCSGKECSGFPCLNWLGVAYCLCINGTYGVQCTRKNGSSLSISGVRVLYLPSVPAGLPVDLFVYWRDPNPSAATSYVYFESSYVEFLTIPKDVYIDRRSFHGQQDIKRADSKFIKQIGAIFCTNPNDWKRFKNICEELSDIEMNNYVHLSLKMEFPFREESEIHHSHNHVLGYYSNLIIKIKNEDQHFEHNGYHWIFVYYNNTKLYNDEDFPKTIKPTEPCMRFFDRFEQTKEEGTAYRKDPIVLGAFVEQLNLMESASGDPRINFVYQVEERHSDNTHRQTKTWMHEGREFRIQPFTLPEGQYRVKITVHVDTKKHGHADNFVVCWFRVEQLGLVAGIIGGRIRTVYSRDDLVMDASPSYNPNIQPHLQQGLFFDWSCNATDLSLCHKHTTKARVHVIKGPLPAGISLLFRLVVYAFNYGNATAEQTVMTTNLSFSSYSVDCLKNCNPINPDKTVYLTTKSTNPDYDEKFVWSYQRGNDTKEYPMTKENRILQDEAEFSIIINDNVLIEGSKYIFFATRINPYGQASISLSTGSRPTFTCDLYNEIEEETATVYVLIDRVSIVCRSQAQGVKYTYYIQFDDQNPLGNILSKGRFSAGKRSRTTAIYLGTSSQWSGRLIDENLYVRAMSKTGCFSTQVIHVNLQWPKGGLSWTEGSIESETRKELSLYENKGSEGNHESSYGGIANWLCYANLLLLHVHSKNRGHRSKNTDEKIYSHEESWKKIHKVFKEKVYIIKASGDSYENIFSYKQILSNLVYIILSSKENGIATLGEQNTLIRTDMAKLVLYLADIFQNKGGKYFHNDVRMTTEEVSQLSEALLICLSSIMQINKVKTTQMSMVKSKLVVRDKNQFQARHGFWNKTEVVGNRFAELSGEPIERLHNKVNLNELRQLKQLTKALEDALLSLVESFSARLLPMEPAMDFAYGNYYIHVRVDTPYYLSVPNFYRLPFFQKPDQTFIQISSELGDALTDIHEFAKFQIMVLYDNPYDWDRDETQISTSLLKVRLISKYGNQWKPLLYIKNPLDMMLRVKTRRSVVLSGTVKSPDKSSARSLALSVLVYRITPPQEKGRGSVYVSLIHVSPTKNLMVALAVNHRPDYKYMISNAVIMEKESRISLNYNLNFRNSFLYLGILPPIMDKRIEIDYTLAIYVARCLVRIKSLWITDKCVMGMNTTMDQVHCRCHYTQTVGASIENPEIILADIYDVEFLRLIVINLLPLYCSLSLIVLFAFLFYYSYRKDKLSQVKANVIVLEDNFPGESCAYLLGVYTGTQWNCGTTSNVGVRLIGANSESRAHILRSSLRKTLKTYTDDWFLIYTSSKLGKLNAIDLWMDYSGSSPDWFCRKVVVYDWRTQVKYEFTLGFWMRVTDESALLEVRLKPQPLDYKNFLTRLHENLVCAFQEMHYIIAISHHHPRSFLSQAEFVTVPFIYVYFVAFFLLIYYKYDGHGTEDYPYYHLESIDIVIAVIAQIPALLISSICLCLFKNKVSTKRTRTWQIVTKVLHSVGESLVQKAQDTKALSTHNGDLEAGAGEGKSIESRISLTGTSRNPTTSQKARSMRAWFKLKQLPLTLGNESVGQVSKDVKKSLVACMVACVAMLGSCIGTSVVGFSMGSNKGLIWITIFLFSIMLGLVVSSSITIFVQALLFTIFTKVRYDEPWLACDTRLGEQQELVGDPDHLENLLERRKGAEYHPVEPSRLLEIRANIAMKTLCCTLCDILVAVVLYLMVFMNMLNSWPRSNFWSTFHLVRLVDHSSYMPGNALKNVENITDFNDYLKNSLSYAYCRRTWYNGMPLSPPGDRFEESGWIENFSFRMFGVIQLRLKRSKGVGVAEGWLGERIAKLIPYWKQSMPILTADTEDTGNYTLGWAEEKEVVEKDFPSQWRFLPPGHQPSLIRYGKRGYHYSSGGYFLHLARNLDRSQTILWKTEEAGWIDQKANVLFINMCIYNPNMDTISIVTACLELRATHGIETSFQVLHMNTQNQKRGIDFLLWLVIVPFMLALSASWIISLLHNGLKYFCSFWNLLNLCVILLVYFNFAMSIKNDLVTKFSLQNYLETSHESFYPYGWVDYHSAPYKIMYIVLVVCVTVKLFQHCAVTLRVAPVFHTFRLAHKHLIGILAVAMPLIYVQNRVVESLLFNDRLTPGSSPLVNKVGLKNYASEFTFSEDKFVPFIFCIYCYIVITLISVILVHHYQMARNSVQRVTDQVDLIEAVRTSFDASRRLRAGAERSLLEDKLVNINTNLDRIVDFMSCMETWF